MGQAKLRGTKEARVAEAEAGIALALEARERAEREREAEVARQWALLSPEEQDRRLEAAKRKAEAYGMMVGEFGHDVTMGLLSMGSKK